jgi:prepilin-type N-terminal cleavage/methylation domain-containing protein
MNRSGNRSGNRPGTRGQRGFTLIELMVALLVSSLLVGMILAIFSRMSLAYRGQQQIAGVQQVLAAARAAIELDAKQAGLGIPQGFKTAIPGRPALESPVQVTNSNSGPDQIALFYADTSIQGQLTQPTPVALASPVGFDDVSAFTPGMVVVLTTSSTAANPLSTPLNPLPDIATYDACVLRIAAVNLVAEQVTFDAASPWGTSFAHCTNLAQSRTMMYRFVAHAYRIDPTVARLPLGVLQRSQTGGLLSNLPGNPEVWDDQAYGFSDIQTAVRRYDPTQAVDLDGDGDANRNWYSSAAQDAVTRAAVAPSTTSLLGASISLIAHTDRNVEGIATAATPDLIGPPAPAAVNAANNSIGDRPSTALPAAPPDPLLPGQRIYRWTTFQVDFRNLGVGVAL